MTHAEMVYKGLLADERKERRRAQRRLTNLQRLLARAYAEQIIRVGPDRDEPLEPMQGTLPLCFKETT